MSDDRKSSPVHKMIEAAEGSLRKQGHWPVYTVAEASEQVGRSINTLKRWHRTGGPKPSMQMTLGKLLVWLYTEDDLDICRQYGMNQRTGPKVGSIRNPREMKEIIEPHIENLGRTEGILPIGQKPSPPKVNVRKIKSPNKKPVKRTNGAT